MIALHELLGSFSGLTRAVLERHAHLSFSRSGMFHNHAAVVIQYGGRRQTTHAAGFHIRSALGMKKRRRSFLLYYSLSSKMGACKGCDYMVIMPYL